MTRSPASRSPRLPSASSLAWAADGLAVAVVSASLVGTAFANAVLPSVFAGLGDASIAYRGALVLPTTRVVVWGLEIEVADRVGQWHVSADRATARIAPGPLWRRTFEARGLTGAGVELVHTPWPDGELRAPAPDPWNVSLIDLDLPDLRRFGARQVRVRGDAHLTGTLLVADETTFDGAVTCDPCDVRRVDGHRLAELQGTVELAGVRGQRGEPLSLDVLSDTDGEARVTGTFPDLEALDIQASLAPWAEIVGEAEGELDLGIEDGALTPGSAVRLRGRPFGVRLNHYVVTGTADVTMTIDPVQTGPRTRIEGTFEDYALVDVAVDGEHSLGAQLAHGGEFRFQVRTPSASLTEIHSPIDGRAVIPPTVIDDLSMLERWVPRGSGITVHSGVGGIEGEVSVTLGDEPSTEGHLTVDADELRLTWDEHDIVTDARAEVSIADGDPSEGFLDISGTRLNLNDLGMSDAVDGRNWWADVAVLDGTLQQEPELVFDADLAFACPDSSPLVSLITGESTAGWVRGLLTKPDVSGRGSLTLTPDRYEMTDFDLEAGNRAEVRLHMRRGEHQVRQGAMFAKLGILSVGVQFDEDRRQFHLFNARSWYNERARTF